MQINKGNFIFSMLSGINIMSMVASYVGFGGGLDSGGNMIFVVKIDHGEMLWLHFNCICSVVFDSTIFCYVHMQYTVLSM